ncbi:MAG: sigma-70 family RNA polymerase sigma factor [Saprospiraceae bacterium]|nr:sigma-70 family RNA polymerase sigma factor [Saprospiraceae bacterium]
MKGNDARARERLSIVLLSAQNQNYAKYLVQSLSIRSLDHQDFLQESVIILLQNIENDKFRLEPGSSNEVDRKRIFKYFREIVYRQVHKVYRDDKKLTQLDDQFDHINQSDSLSTADDKFDLAVYQCFHSLDPVSQKMLKHLFSDNLSPKEVAKKMNHPEFPNTKDIVEHKFNCLQKLKSLTSEKLLEMDQKSFNTYLEVSKSALKNLDEPCKTILTNILPPIHKSYKEMLSILKNSKIPEKEFLKTEDQVKKRKYKCMITLQDRIWQNLLTQIN